MNYCVFDTETTSVEKPFCYNIGYVIVNDEIGVVLERDYVVEQVWHNPMLFTTAYYADKRDIYVSRMRSKQTIMDKFGYICQQMIRDFKMYDISMAFAYNSSFDERVFNYNCDWFKCNNPFDNIEIKDIRGFAHNFLIDDKFKEFCEKNEYFTESGNYSTTAETLFRFVSGDNDFVEEHTALADSRIENIILRITLDSGADINKTYASKMSIKRQVEKTLHIRTAEQTDYYFDYSTIRINKERTEVTLK